MHSQLSVNLRVSDYSRVTKNISGENRMLQFSHVKWDSSLFSIVGSADVFELSFS